MTRILNFGSCNIDYVYSLDRIAAAGETEASKGLRIFPGGKGLNQSIAAARAGATVFHAGCVGADGRFLCDILTDSGVDASAVRVSEEKTGHAIIQVADNGENSIITCAGANRSLTEEQIDAVLCGFSSDDILILQNEINMVDVIIEKAYRKGMRIMLDPSPLDSAVRRLDLGMLTYIVLDGQEAIELSGADDAFSGLDRLSARYPSLKLVLDLGRGGYVYQSAQERLYSPSFQVEAVDNTAGGGTFAGYFIAAIAASLPPSEALRLASAAAALAISSVGAAPSVPYMSQVRVALETLSPARSDGEAERQRRLIERYMDAHVRDARLGGLAELLGYSEVYTSELVKKLTKRSFSALLIERRCALAARMLEESELSVGEIIYRVGYENESFFRRLFTERYGSTPLAYRRAAREKRSNARKTDTK